ncbi:MAG TPA: L,D-transpeptidase, partial [Nocardioides sp.]|nr:L,D-transpeptidase [Nocardioides sp.]
LPHGSSPSAAAHEAGAELQAVAAPASTPTTTPTAPTGSASTPSTTVDTPRTTARKTVSSTALPAASGHGRRIVFSQSQQRVWLVGPDGGVIRTYLVSGSVTNNLHPGTYQVYSRSRWAVGVDDSGTMQYFVRFTHGPTGAAIGFHSIPQKSGEPLQTVAQLGTPRSHGCIRQATADAIALWHFAPDGTTVVVTA